MLNYQIEQLDRTKFSLDRFAAIMRQYGELLPDPFSKRKNFDCNAYIEKNYKFADILLAVSNDKVIGLACFYANDAKTHFAFLSLLAIDPQFQGFGVGKRLVSKMIEIARNKKMLFASLEVSRNNKRALRLYRKEGFIVVAPCVNEETSSYKMTRSLTVEQSSSTPVTQWYGSDAFPFMKRVDLRIKRDDLFYQTIGSAGSKARKAPYIVNYAASLGCDCVVTNGAINSNHTRATTLYASRCSIKTHLVLHTSDPKNPPSGTNLFLSRLCRPYIEYCRLDDLGKAMDKAMEYEKTNGLSPFYIWGGGHCPQGTRAYVDAVQEFLEQTDDWIPDYVFVASGTGTTQAGLTIGFANFPTRVIGVSVARSKERGTEVVEQAIRDYGVFFKEDVPKAPVYFDDSALFGGYEGYSDSLLKVIEKVASTGLILDPTYTGKPFFRMLQMVEHGEINPGAKILFWHTGGLLNLISSSIPISK